MKTTNTSKKENRDVTPSAQPGMGAIVNSEGTTFRVWAPHADQVFVMGTFNDWSETAHPLAREENGYWSVDVKEAQPRDEYKYLIINGSDEFVRIDPYAREVTSSAGNSIIPSPDFDWEGDDFQMPPWNELITYEMHVGTFNTKPEKGPPGNLWGVIEKLPYLRDLGINTIELMPPMEFPGHYSWGYNIAHPFAVETDYGGVNALKELVKAAHFHGIAVLLDVVYNHFATSDLDLWQFDGWHENDKGGIYFYNDWRSETDWGDTRPDYGRAEVRQYLRDNALMWFDEYHIDGLRWDGTAFIRNVHGNEVHPSNDLPDGWSLMQWINEEIKERYPRKLTTAEDLKENAWIVKETDVGGAGFDAQWDASFVHPVRRVIISQGDEFRDMNLVRDAILHRYNDDAFKRVIYTESHDEVANGRARVPEEIWPGKADSWFSKKRSTLGAALVFTAPGMPLIFQGQEFLEDQWFRDEDPLDWSRADRFSGLVDMYRDMIRLRRNLDGATRGLTGQHVEVHHINNEEKIVAFHRWDQGGPGDSVVVVLNMAEQSHDNYNLGFPEAGIWKVRFNSDGESYDAEFSNHPSPDVETEEEKQDGMPYRGAVSIGPYTALILSQELP